MDTLTVPGVRVLQGVRHRSVPWSQVDRMRVVRDRRTLVLELDLGTTLVLLSRQRLGRHPEDVLSDLLALRSAAVRPTNDLGEADGSA